MFLQHSISSWIIFHAIVVFLLVLDLGVLNRKAHVIRMKEATLWSLFWIAIGVSFSVYIFHDQGKTAAIEYLTGYVVEKSLSVDNLFVFLIIFKAFKVERQYQHRLLFWGIVGAIILRAIMIYSGSALIESFHWIIYVFGAFLIYLGVKLAKGGGEDLNPLDSLVYKLASKVLPVSKNHHPGRFTVVENGKRLFTDSFFCLLMIETSDVIFAVDSVPAVFGVTRDPYIVYTSNIFAILGLRSLFFVLEELLEKFHHLKKALAIILLFVGTKMCLEKWVKIPPQYSLMVILSILLISVLTSIQTEKKRKKSH